MTVPLTEEDLHELYLWVDDIPISRQKRNITRDFSDGCCVAEVVKFFFPKLVDLHNYTPGMSLRQKRDNWNTLNNRVFRKLHFEVPQEEINDITAGVPGAIERFLRALRTKIAQIKACREEMGTNVVRPSGSGNGRSAKVMRPHVERGFCESPKYRQGAAAEKTFATHRSLSNGSGTAEAQTHYCGGGGNSTSAIRLLLDEKDRTIFELREAVDLLNKKISKLEELVRVKDEKLNSYRAKLGPL